MTEAEELFHRIAREMPDAKEGKMFGALCIKAPNGKAAVMFWKNHMIFKLTGEDQHEALGLDGAKIFTPMDNKPMNGWIQLSYEHAAQWPDLAQRSMDLVKTLR